MSNVLLFNPENDLALASGHVGFTPPSAAVELRESGALLPLWWADKDDFILVPDESYIGKAENLKKRYGLTGTAVTRIPVRATAAPWGWSAYTRRLMENAGVPLECMPDDAGIRKMRMLSHRRTTIAVHKAIGTPTEQIPVEAASTEQAMDAVARWKEAVVKLPWSSSGRGVLYSRDIPQKTLTEYISGIIHRQGSVLVEPHFDRIKDFATLFYSDGDRVHFRGLSLFSTDNRGCYNGNIAARQGRLQEILGTDIGNLTASLSEALTDILTPFYRGWLGVDMLMYNSGNGMTAIAPCIEVNLRMTMGVAAMMIAERALSEDGQGILRIARKNQPTNGIDVSPTGGCFRFMLDMGAPA